MKKQLFKSLFCVILSLSLILGVTGCDNDTPDDTAASLSETSSDESLTTSSSYQSQAAASAVSSYYDPTKEGVFKIRPVVQKSYYDEDNSLTLPYCMILPVNYDENKDYPVLLYLHGAGERGNDNETQFREMVYTLYRHWEEHFDEAILLAPQCPQTGWWNLYVDENGQKSGELNAVMNLLTYVQNEYSCDKNRIYVMGYSMGGYGTWQLLDHYNDVFAAGVPICGWYDTSAAKVMKDTPIWIYHGTKDETVSVENSRVMYSALKSAGSTKVTYTEQPYAKHSVWNDAAVNKKLFDWMFEQSLKNK